MSTIYNLINNLISTMVNWGGSSNKTVIVYYEKQQKYIKYFPDNKYKTIALKTKERFHLSCTKFLLSQLIVRTTFLKLVVIQIDN